MPFDIIPIQPQHPILKRHIDYYYYLKTDTDDFETKYFAFPHTHTVLNIHNQANYFIEGYYTHIFGKAGERPIAAVQGIRDQPLLAHLQGKLDKVTILFKPLGINHFLQTGFGQLYKQISQPFTAWDDLPAYQQFLTAFYGVDDTANRSVILEDYLMAIYKPVESHDLLEKAIVLLSNFNVVHSIEEIADQLNISTRTFNRVFNNQLGVSPATFRKVARFRHSLQNSLVQQNFNRMTDLAYQSNYYDQAYFNKIYRGLTGSSPQRFFKQIDKLADNKLIFQFTGK